MTAAESITAPAAPRHPARFSPEIMAVVAELAAQYLDPFARIIDPFAGTGRVHDLGLDSVGVELEPEWAGLHPRTIVGDATALRFAPASFDGAITSPCYGNRMADHHEARDGSYRRTYRHLLGRPLSSGSAAALQWGDAYRDLHRRAWSDLRRVLRPGGMFILNVKNHVRHGAVMPVVEWHLVALDALGFAEVDRHYVVTPGARYGENGHARVDHEIVAVLRRDERAVEVGS